MGSFGDVLFLVNLPPYKPVSQSPSSSRLLNLVVGTGLNQGFVKKIGAFVEK